MRAHLFSGGVSALFLLGCISCAEAEAESKSVFMDVEYVTAGTATDVHWRSVYGSYGKTQRQSKALLIEVRNMSKLPGRFRVEWYFIGKPLSGTKRFIYDHGAKDVELDGGDFTKLEVESDDLTSTRFRSRSGRYYYKSGDKADGWLVRAISGDEVVRVKASSVAYEKYGRDEEQLQRLIERAR
jgi:hypothetical protein